MKRRTWKYFFVMLLIAAVAWVGSESLQDKKPLAPLDALIVKESQSGWRVSRQPDVAGPYRRGENPQYVGRGTLASVTLASPDGPVSIRLPARDDVEQMIVPLRTADGRVAVAVLER